MKILNFKGIIALLFFFRIFFFLNLNFQKKKEIKNINTSEVKEDDFLNTNIIKDIKYSSKDLKGNEYIILAEEGEIDLNNSDIIFLKNVQANINLFKKNETIKIKSKFGKYNTVNYDTIFSKNVKIEYINHTITGDYLDFSMIKNILIISKNVVYKNLENILKADVIELDTITKDAKIFMYNINEKVNVESLN